MGDMDCSEHSGIDECVSQTYSVFFLGPGYLARETAQELITKSDERKRNLIAAPTIGEISFYRRNRIVLEGEIRELRGKVKPTALETKITTPLDHLDPREIEKWKAQWADKAIVEAVLDKQPDVTVITIRSDKEDQLRKQNKLKDRFARASYNIPELEAYAPFFRRYKGVVVMVTNPPDICAQAFCAATGMDPQKVIGFNEIDSFSLRRYLFTDGPIFAETDFTGTQLEGPEKKEERQRFLDIVGVGLEKLGVPKRSMYANIGALAYGAHGEDLAPVISCLKPEQLEAVKAFFGKQGITDERGILERIRTAVGSGIRKYYTEIKEQSPDVPPVIAELVDAIGLVTASRKDLREQKGNNAYALIPPTASAYIQPYTHPVKTWFGFPVDIRYDCTRGVVVDLITNWESEGEKVVVLSDIEKEMVREAYDRYAKKVKKFAETKGVETIAKWGMDRPLNEVQKPAGIKAGSTLLYSESKDNNAEVYAVDKNTKNPFSGLGKKNPLIFRGVGYFGLKFVNIHDIKEEEYWIGGHTAGVDVISPEGITRRFSIPGTGRADSSAAIDDLVIISKRGAGLHVIQADGPFAKWELQAVQKERTQNVWNLKSHEGFCYFMENEATQRSALKRMQRDGEGWSISNALDALDMFDVTAYDIDSETGILYAAGTDHKQKTVIGAMDITNMQKRGVCRVPVQRITNLATGNDTEKTGYIAFLTERDAYCVTTQNVTTQEELTTKLLAKKKYSIEQAERIALDAATKTVYILSIDSKRIEWNIESENVQISGSNTTALKLV